MNDQSDNGLLSRKKRAAFGLFGILLYKRYIPPGDVKPFKLRWVILGMFVLVFFLNKFFG